MLSVRRMQRDAELNDPSMPRTKGRFVNGRFVFRERPLTTRRQGRFVKGRFARDNVLVGLAHQPVGGRWGGRPREVGIEMAAMKRESSGRPRAADARGTNGQA